jgi:hypothetical protein
MLSLPLSRVSRANHKSSTKRRDRTGRRIASPLNFDSPLSSFVLTRLRSSGFRAPRHFLFIPVPALFLRYSFFNSSLSLLYLFLSIRFSFCVCSFVICLIPASFSRFAFGREHCASKGGQLKTPQNPPLATRHCTWGVRPPPSNSYKEGQTPPLATRIKKGQTPPS